MMAWLEAFLEDTDSFNQFREYVNEMAKKDKLWCLWADFVFSNCYPTLYLAIYSSNWKLQPETNGS